MKHSPILLIALCTTSLGAAQDEKPESPKRLAAGVQLAQIGTACRMFAMFNGRDPKDLKELVVRPEGIRNWPEGGFLMGRQDVPPDPWGNAYVWEPGGKIPNLRTLGADGRPGGEGEDADLSFEEATSGLTKPDLNEQKAVKSMQAIVVAEADFRSNDRDGNRVNDFWTGDVHALFALCPVAAGRIAPEEKPAPELMIKLIESSVAEADSAPLKMPGLGQNPPEKPKPKDGYLYRAMERDNWSPYKNDTDGPNFYGAVHDRNRFGFCAYPAEYGKTGRRTYIVNEDNMIWWKDTGGEPVNRFPLETRKEGWTRLD